MASGLAKVELDQALDVIITTWKTLRFSTPAEENKRKRAEQAAARDAALTLRAATRVLDRLLADSNRLWPKTTILMADPVRTDEPENVLLRLRSEIEYVARSLDRQASLSRPRGGRPRDSHVQLLVWSIAEACAAYGLQFTDATNGAAAQLLQSVFERAGIGRLSASALRPHLRYGRAAQKASSTPTSKKPSRKRA